jgi:hypothetical protein
MQGAHKKTHVADKDSFALLTTASGMVGKLIGGHRSTKVGSRGGATSKSASSSTEASTATPKRATTSAESTTKAATASEAASSSGKTSTTSAEPSATHAESPSTSKTVLPYFELTTLPVMTIELSNSIASIFRGFKSDNPTSLGTSVGSDMYISANRST